MRSNKKIILFFLFLFLIPIINAAPPVSTQITGSNNLLISNGLHMPFELGKDHDFEFHIINGQNGLPLNASYDVECWLHVYNATGQHIIEDYNNVFTHDWDIGFDVVAGDLPVIGKYNYKTYCICHDCSIDQEYPELGGFIEEDFFVTETGTRVDEGNSLYFALMFVIIILIFALLYTANEIEAFDIEYNKKVDKNKYEVVKIPVDKYLIYIVAGWLTLPLLSITIKINQVYNMGLTNTLNVLYKAATYLMLTISIIATILILIYLFIKFNNYILERLK